MNPTEHLTTDPDRDLGQDEVDLPIRPFSASLPMALLRAREATMRRFRPMLADHSLTEQQWRVLRALAASPAPMAIGEVADRTFLLGPSLSRIVANLEDRDLIGRTTAADDQRRSNLALTASGRALVRAIAPHSEDSYGTIEDAFGKDRLRALLDELHELTTSLSASPSASLSDQAGVDAPLSGAPQRKESA